MASALDIYVGTHFVGSTGGTQLIRRIAASHHGSTDVLDRLVREIDYDRRKLSDIMKKLDITPSRTAVLGAWLGGQVAGLQLTDRVFGRTPLTALTELEAMLLGVEGKAALWRALRLLAKEDDRLDSAELDYLLSLAEGQIAALEAMRSEVAVAVLREG
ncbi:hypothetical protein JGU71_01610 [Antrihabitans sp. YC3-6]|uniref:Uncharacterized protein n=1 Tax=Antrihabitans stalagmiti TaxID=2799499 RepID=A0A934NLV0_9NOCA|nr:hypothetical protein [Antrihabitans stalagmiti]MBJ8337572.1 hypothetical protein [Antrihabitans stalagmiti]